jgi:tRNA (guanine-N7-)-methyltransferase
MSHYPHVFQYPFATLKEKNFEMKGYWNEKFFQNNNPIVLELGCGKGEYTVELGKLFPEKNFIGVDIKGSRMWTGARQSFNEGMKNIAFLRTHIELIDRFFGKNEVSEIWITFPDPQMSKVNKRMTSTRFIKMYRQILNENGLIHLKTDSNFMFTYTDELVKVNGFPVLVRTEDLYHSELADEILSIQTFYEQQWLDRGLNIKYLRFICEPKEVYLEPDIEIEQDSYRSFNRSKRSQKTYGAIS